MVFGTNALIVKPAISLSPMLVVAVLNKYGYSDLRPALERASARETAARVAAGAICKLFLQEFNITIGGYVTSIGDITADLDELDYSNRFSAAELSDVRCPDPQAALRIHELIRKVMEQRDTLGGVDLAVFAHLFCSGYGEEAVSAAYVHENHAGAHSNVFQGGFWAMPLAS